MARLTSISQKAQRTSIRVLEGADVGVLWSYVVEETGLHGGKHRPWTGDHYLPHADTGNWTRAAVVTSEGFTPALSKPLLFSYNWAATWQNPTKRPRKTQISLGMRPVWSESLLCAQWEAKDPGFLHADSKDSDQTGRMPRLIWVFAERTAFCHVAAHISAVEPPRCGVTGAKIPDCMSWNLAGREK